MSLAECLTAALENNLDLAIAKKDPEIADQDVMFQEAAFDPILGARAGYTARRQETTNTTTQITPPAPPVSTTESPRPSTNRSARTCRGVLNFGATYDVRLAGSTAPGNRARSSSRAFRSAMRSTTSGPTAGTTGSASTCRLLRGFGKDVNDGVAADRASTISTSATRRFSAARSRRSSPRRGRLLGPLARPARRRRSRTGPRAVRGSVRAQQEEGRGRNAGTDRDHPGRGQRRLERRGDDPRPSRRSSNAEDNLRRSWRSRRTIRCGRSTILPTEKPMSEPRTVDSTRAHRSRSRDDHRPEIATAKEQIQIAKVNESGRARTA